MNIEQQRIAIAEACGWTDVRFRPSYVVNQPWLGGINPNPEKIEEIIDAETGAGRAPTSADYLAPTNLPDYLNSLDAMSEAEKTTMEHGAWIEAIQRAIWPHREPKRELLIGDIFDIAHATSAQRAEAFLRTIGKWTESPAA